MYGFNYDADFACSGLLSNLKLFTTRVFSSIALIFVLIYNSWQLSVIALVVLFGALLSQLLPRNLMRKMVPRKVSSTAIAIQAVAQ